MFIAPKNLPSFSAITEDLHHIKSKVLAKHLGVSERSIRGWKSQNHAPRAIQLALFWETCWGRSTLNCDLDNLVSRYKGLSNALQNDNNTLRQRIIYLESLGAFGAANQPFLTETTPKIFTRY